MCSGLEWREKQQKFDREEDGGNKHLDLFLNCMLVWVVRELVVFNPRWNGEEGEVEGSIV